MDNYAGDFDRCLGGRSRLAGTRHAPALPSSISAEPLEARQLHGGVLLDEPVFCVRAAFLDHGTPCLGFAVEEKIHVNVWKNRLAGHGLAVGPWLRDLKQAVARTHPTRHRCAPGGVTAMASSEREFTLAALKEAVLRLVPGEKICYVTDVAFHEDNVQRIGHWPRARRNCSSNVCFSTRMPIMPPASASHRASGGPHCAQGRRKTRHTVPLFATLRRPRAALRKEVEAAWVGSPNSLVEPDRGSGQGPGR